VADTVGTFEAVGNTSTASAYKFVGTYSGTPTDPTGSPHSDFLVLGMDDSNQVSGSTPDGSLHGTVTGTTFVGTLRTPDYFWASARDGYPVSGTFANTGSGLTLDGQYNTGSGGNVVTFSTIGCRAN
jgi:hypothetical protein